ncbi:MAG: nucleotidyltransferase family protein [Candidatus Aminicenantes bacterium]|nr:nucleotidyltransferase family protein [Candidatus Aminicenantes bacterium]
MGSPKMLLPFGRKKLIEKVVAGVMKFRVDVILVVLGARRGEIERLLRTYPVKPVFNPNFERGMLSSIQKGLDELPGEVRAVLVVLGDQPWTPASVVERLVAGFERSGKGIVLPVHRGRRGHPALIDLKYKREIMDLDPAVGLRQLLLRHHDDVLEVPVRTPSVLRDIDRPEDFRKALKPNRRIPSGAIVF